MRLIDADYFKKQIAAATLKNNIELNKGLALMELVDAQSTAYDVNKVVEQIKARKICGKCLNNGNATAVCAEFCDIGKELEIIKSGGLEEGNIGAGGRHMQNITSFLFDRKSEYQKRCNRAYEQEKQARKLLEDEPDREDVRSDLNHVIKLQDRYNALIEFIDELQADYF